MTGWPVCQGTVACSLLSTPPMVQVAHAVTAVGFAVPYLELGVPGWWPQLQCETHSEAKPAVSKVQDV